VRLRRRRRPRALVPGYPAFLETLRVVEAATSDLARVMPTTRLPGLPLAETLVAFEEALTDVERRLPSWRTPDIEEQWLAVKLGVADALARARALRERPPEIGAFERLLGTVGELLDPLDVFEAAAAAFEDLRNRSF
jgi:hypothetical protein